QPLTSSSETLNELLATAEADTKGWKYIEVRPLVDTDSYLAAAGLSQSGSAVIHRLDLTQGLDEGLAGFNTQGVRKIYLREREQLKYEEGRSPELLEKFYKLLLVTRRRHQLPPQPLAWFENLIECCGERLKIRVASKHTTPVAAIITFSFKRVATYKYGCS